MPETKQRAAATSVPPEQSSIKRARLRHGLTVRDLAAMLDVTPGAVSQLERSEAAGKIRVDKLRNALAHMGTDLVLTAAPDTPATPTHRAPFARREDRVAYELHRAVARKLIYDPATILAIAERNIPRRYDHVHGTLAHGWVDRWHELIHGPIGELIGVMLAEDNEAKELRQNSPFAGALTQPERLAAIERASRR